MNENELQKQVLDLCRKYKLLVFHSADSRRDTAKGFPDLTIVGQRLIFAELKSEIGRLTTDQVTWKYALLSAGEKYYLWRPSDLNLGRIEKTLQELGEKQ